MTEFRLAALTGVVIEMENGSRPTGGVDGSSEGIFSLGGEHLNEVGGFDLANKKFIPFEFYGTMKRGIVKAHDILIVKDGATTGKVAFVADTFPYRPCCINEHLFRIAVNRKIADPRYVFYYLLGPDGNRQILNDFHGATVGGISQQFLDKVFLPLPSLPEQQRIAGILARADRLRRLRRYALELSEGYLQAVFVEMFGDPVRNPKGWPAKTLAQLMVKFTYGTSAKCFSEPQGLPVLRIPNVLSREISLDDLKYAQLDSREVNTLALRRGDLLFVRTNGNPDYVGRCAIFDLDEKFLFASYLIRARFDPEVIDPWYLDMFLRTEGGRRAMGPYIRTTAGQSNIGVEGLGQIAVPIPSRVLQQRFADVVSRHSRLQIQQREAARQAEQLFEALLGRAFRGELQLPD